MTEQNENPLKIFEDLQNLNRQTFPTEETYDKLTKPGMSLRDWFAGKALQGVLSNPALTKGWSPEKFASIEENCWAIADAMLEERKK